MDRLSTKLTNYILLKGVIEENDFERVCEENSVNNQIFYDNEMAEGSC